MRMAAAILVLTFGSTAIADTGSYGLLESVGGRVDCVAVAGNGQLTVGIDAAGAVSVCRWPGPTAPNQITYVGKAPSNGGALWGIVRGKTIEWLPRTAGDIHIAEGEGAAPVVHATYAHVGVTATAFVHAERAIAVFRLHFSEPQETEVVWTSDFSPCAKNMKSFPSSEMFFPARRDLVAFADNGAIYHARPNNASSRTWEQADAWLEGSVDPDWFEKRDGVWIGYSSSTSFSGAVCGAERGDRSASALAESAEWDRQTKAVGACASAVRIPLDADGTSATVFVAFGERRAQVDEALSAARATGFDGLLEETERSWREKRSAAARPASAPASIAALYERALQRLYLCADDQSGAVVRAPYARPPFAVDMPRFGAWTTLAFDLANDTDAGGRLARFHARCVRTSDAPGAPAGSLPAAVYSSGDDASPPAVLDVHAVAWLLWSIRQHDTRIAEQERQGYREELWTAVELAGDFVSSWCRAVRDAPVVSFDPTRLSDTATIETVAAAYAGLRAAGSFANATGHDKPEWAARTLELEDYLRFHALNAAGDFEIAAPLVLWPTELVAAGDPRWEAPVQAIVDRINASKGPESLKALADAAMLLRDQKDKLALLEPLVGPTVQSVMDAYPCDSYYSALAITIILTVYNP